MIIAQPDALSVDITRPEGFSPEDRARAEQLLGEIAAEYGGKLISCSVQETPEPRPPRISEWADIPEKVSVSQAAELAEAAIKVYQEQLDKLRALGAKVAHLSLVNGVLPDEEMLVSPRVNTLVDSALKVEGRNPDDKYLVEICPFVMIDGQRVFSDPPVFAVGEPHPDYPHGPDLYPLLGWEENMLSRGIPAQLIAEVKGFLEDRAPSGWEDWD